jgi:hypothetical protein
MDQHINGQPSAVLWAQYEQQVVVTDAAWQTYATAAAQAEAKYQEYRQLSRCCEDAYLTWCQANETRNRLYDAYWATYNRKAA